VQNIYAVDNILDLKYFKTVLPALAERRHSASIFYEIRSKVTRDQLQAMRHAGIGSVQPGIESLSTELLRLMRKGVEAYHNVRMLKWCEELGITPVWHLLYGFPGEQETAYDDIIAMLPLLAHLKPPVVGRVRLDRFSPLHFDGLSLGVKAPRPTDSYRHVYGVPEDALVDLAYYFDFEFLDGRDPELYADKLRAAVNQWKKSYAHSALIKVDVADATLVYDSRPCAVEPRRLLQADETHVLRSAERGLRRDQVQSPPEVVDRLIEFGWLLPIDGRLLSLTADYTPLVPPSVPLVLMEDFCLELAASRHIGATDDLNVDNAQAEGASLSKRWASTANE
jgi:ribosomal peptide maturation radical SAM protein 1